MAHSEAQHDRLDEIVKRLGQLENSRDEELAHSEGDQLLLEALRLLGQSSIADAFERIPRWYA